MVVVEIIIVVMLFVLNGFFAMAEFAIVSSRRVRLERLAQEGHEGAQAALALIDDPARMLAAVQVGFTTTATIAGIFSGATLADRLGDAVAAYPAFAAYGKPVAIFAVTIAVTYAALIIGELVPKQIALSNPEPIALRVAQLLSSVAKVAAPVVWLLNASTRLLLRLLRVRPRLGRTVTEEDIHLLVAEGARLGVIHNVERDMIEGVLDLADSPIRTIMTPRPRVQWVDLDGSNDDILRTIRACPHAQLLACRGSLDGLVGVVRKQDLLGQALDQQFPDVGKATGEPLVVPEATSILRTLDLFRKTPVHTAVVVDEFGTVQGIVTRTDLLEAVAGDLPKIDAPAWPKVTRRDDGSFLVDASVSISDVADLIGRQGVPPGDFVTLGGFLMSELQQMPKPGDHVVWAGWRFEVVDVDGRRIDMVLVQRAPEG
jgi:putative hemolysin